MSRVTCTHRANGAPPPPFPNALYQSLSAGETSLNMVHYLWDRNADPVVDADFTPGAARWRPLLVVDRWVGAIHVRPPRAAHAWSLVSGGPSMLNNVFVTGIPTGSPPPSTPTR